MSADRNPGGARIAVARPRPPRLATAALAAALLATSSPGIARAVAVAPPAGTALAPSAQSLYESAEQRLATRKTDDLVTSLDLFLDAVRLDPGHARAHAGAATAASLLALYSVSAPRPLFATARAEARAALRLEPELASAQAAMGLIEYLDGWDMAGAESRLREALRLDPRYGSAWHWYGMMLMATGRFDASIDAFDHAIAIEPESSLYQAKRAAVLAGAGRVAEAERELRSVIERFPQSALARRELGYLLVNGGDGEQGVAALRQAAELLEGEDSSADLAWGYARVGRRAEAEAIAARLIARSTAAGSTEYLSPLDPAIIYAGLERRDDAFAWLERAVADHDPGLVYLAVSPPFAPLRDDPRFQALLRTVGLGGEGGREPPARATEGRQRTEGERR